VKRLVLLGLVALGGCRAPADASVLLDLVSFENSAAGFRSPSATLDVLDDQDQLLAVEIDDDDLDEPAFVQSPVPVPCAGDACLLTLKVRPGPTRFVLHLTSTDRCGARGEVVRFSSELLDLSPWSSNGVQLALDTTDFDDDKDGLVNILEDTVCGRLDVVDGALAPAGCADPADPCCAGTSSLEGHMTAFAGGAHTLADGSTANVAPFALDDTEVTWRQLARCVARGACLAGAREHPLRLALIDGVNMNEPVVGLLPREAEELCASMGKRLPLDVEWDFAAAHRDGTDARARFPWSEDGVPDDDVGCAPDDAGLAANHAISGAACPGRPLPVGSYPSTNATRGAGLPLADLGGNAAEWTVFPGDAPSLAELPPDVAAVSLRGGGATSPLALLENDLPVTARLPSNGDIEAWRASIVRLSSAAGVRCAIDVDDGTVAPVVAAEPACEAPATQP
jgi:hypothetical protein